MKEFVKVSDFGVHGVLHLNHLADLSGRLPAKHGAKQLDFSYTGNLLEEDWNKFVNKCVYAVRRTQVETDTCTLCANNQL